MDRKKLDEWIEEGLRIARKYRDEAEESREESGYTDIDALEQSRYNEGIIATLMDLKEFLAGKKKR